MKNHILFCFILTIATFTTSCEKEQILQEEIQADIQERDFGHLTLPSTISMKVANQPFTKKEKERIYKQSNFNNIQKEKKEAPPNVNFEKVKPCYYGDCNPQIEDYSELLQERANESCEVQFGEVVCCADGTTVYVLMMAEPNDLGCHTDKGNPINDRTAEPNDGQKPTSEIAKETKLIRVDINAVACLRDAAFTLTAFDKVSGKPFESRRISVDWFENDNYLGSGHVLNCVSDRKVTVIVQDLINNGRGTATIYLGEPHDKE